MAGEKGQALSTGYLGLIFNGTAITGLAQNTTSTPLTSLYLSLHTADPTLTGTQSTSEVTYTSYARVAVVRTSSGFTVGTASVTLTSPASFPAGTGGSGTATYFAVGTLSTGAGQILYTGPIAPSITLGNGITPILSAATNITEV